MSIMMSRFHARAAIIATAFLLVPAAAAAQTATTATPEVTASAAARGSNDNLVSAFGLLGYAYANSGFGLGARYQKTLVPVGVIKSGSVHDEFAIEGGLDYYRYGFDTFGASWSYNEIAIVAGAVWNFWLLEDKLALYPKIDFAYRFGSFSTNNGVASPVGYGGLWIQGAAGAAYRVGALALRAEAGSGSLRLGAGYTF